MHIPLKLALLTQLVITLAPDLTGFPSVNGFSLRAALSALLRLRAAQWMACHVYGTQPCRSLPASKQKNRNAFTDYQIGVVFPKKMRQQVKKILIAAALSLSASHAASESVYSPNYFMQLSALGLEREAFLYALTWSAKNNVDAETAVANALIEGIGVEANPKAAISVVCRSRAMSDFDKRKLLIQANMRLVGEAELPLRCASDGG